MVIRIEFSCHAQRLDNAYTLYLVVMCYGYAEIVFNVQSDNISLCQTHLLVSLIAINSCLSESILLSLPPQIKIYRSIFTPECSIHNDAGPMLYIKHTNEQMNGMKIEENIHL